MVPKWPLHGGPFWHYYRGMSLAQTVKDVNVTDLAEAVGLPRRTLFRWVELDTIPGREPEKKLWAEKIAKAAAKLRKAA